MNLNIQIGINFTVRVTIWSTFGYMYTFFISLNGRYKIITHYPKKKGNEDFIPHNMYYVVDLARRMEVVKSRDMKLTEMAH